MNDIITESQYYVDQLVTLLTTKSQAEYDLALSRGQASVIRLNGLVKQRTTLMAGLQ